MDDAGHRHRRFVCRGPTGAEALPDRCSRATPAREHASGASAWAINQDKNFGMVWSWFDSLAGTRDVFVGNEKDCANCFKHVAGALTASAGAVLRAERRSPLRRFVKTRPQ
jgi:hypothetical protein